MTKKIFPYFPGNPDADPEIDPDQPQKDSSSEWDQYFDSRKYARTSILTPQFLHEAEYPTTDEGVGLLRAVMVQSHAFSTIIALMYRDQVGMKTPYPDELTQSVSSHIRKNAMTISQKYQISTRYSDEHLRCYLNTLPPNKAWPFFVPQAVYEEFGLDPFGRLPTASSGERPFALTQPKSVNLLSVDDKNVGQKWAGMKQKVMTRISDEIETLRDAQTHLIVRHGLNLPYGLNAGLIQAAFDITLNRKIDIVKLNVRDWLPDAVNMAINIGIGEAKSVEDGGSIDDYCSGPSLKH